MYPLLILIFLVIAVILVRSRGRSLKEGISLEIDTQKRGVLFAMSMAKLMIFFAAVFVAVALVVLIVGVLVRLLTG